jgi:hypothetical protein
VVAVAPQILHGPSCGHDFDFHLVSWFDCLNSWRHGILYPHWAPNANFGAGEPRFLFYPPLTWMLGAALGALLPWQLVPLTLTFLLLAGTGLATRALAREALPDGAATLAGCAALFSGYALFTTYERSAFGELAGGLWIPLLLLFALRDRNVSHPFRKEREMDGAPDMPSARVYRRAFDGSAVPLALVVACCWLSNLPLGVMACYLLAATELATALLSRSWAPVLRAAVAVAVGIGLTSIFLLPAIFEQHWVAISQATNFPGEMIENSFLFGRHADPALHDHDVELHRVSLIAVTMLAVTLLGMFIFWLRGRRTPEGQSIARRWWLPLALIRSSSSPASPLVARLEPAAQAALFAVSLAMAGRSGSANGHLFCCCHLARQALAAFCGPRSVRCLFRGRLRLHRTQLLSSLRRSGCRCSHGRRLQHRRGLRGR